MVLARYENTKTYWMTSNLHGEALLTSYKELMTASIIYGIEPLKRKELRDFLRARDVQLTTGTGHPILGVLLGLLPNSRTGESTALARDANVSSRGSNTDNTARIIATAMRGLFCIYADDSSK